MRSIWRGIRHGKIVAVVLTAGLIMFFSLGTALAKQHKAVPKSKPAPAAVDTSNRSDVQAASNDLARTSKEAGGQQSDEQEQFKHSASVRLVAKLTGLSLDGAYWLCVSLNFAVLAGFMIWAARKYLPGIFRDRTRSIQHAMEEARRTSEEAQRRLSEIESRLSRLGTEIEEMRQAAEKEAMEEEARIKSAANEDARRIVKSAEQEITAAARAARRDLTAYAADLAVSLARKQIHVDAGTDHELIRNFARQLDTQPKGNN